MLETIVCPVDGSEHSGKAVELAADLAARYDTKLCFLHVYMKNLSTSELERFARQAHLKDLVEQELTRMSEFISATAGSHPVTYVPPPTHDIVTRLAEVLLEDARQTAVAKSVNQVRTDTMDGRPADCILEYARNEYADMIVMGNRGLGGLQGLFLGSTSQKVGHQCECTCVTVK